MATPRTGTPVSDLCENVQLTTAAADYAWVNARQVWVCGTVDSSTGRIHIDAYMQ